MLLFDKDIVFEIIVHLDIESLNRLYYNNPLVVSRFILILGDNTSSILSSLHNPEVIRNLCLRLNLQRCSSFEEFNIELDRLTLYSCSLQYQIEKWKSCFDIEEAINHFGFHSSYEMIDYLYKTEYIDDDYHLMETLVKSLSHSPKECIERYHVHSCFFDTMLFDAAKKGYDIEYYDNTLHMIKNDHTERLLLPRAIVGNRQHNLLKYISNVPLYRQFVKCSLLAYGNIPTQEELEKYKEGTDEELKVYEGLHFGLSMERRSLVRWCCKKDVSEEFIQYVDPSIKEVNTFDMYEVFHSINMISYLMKEDPSFIMRLKCVPLNDDNLKVYKRYIRNIGIEDFPSFVLSVISDVRNCYNTIIFIDSEIQSLESIAEDLLLRSVDDDVNYRFVSYLVKKYPNIYNRDEMEEFVEDTFLEHLDNLIR